MNGFDDSAGKGYWTKFRVCYWSFAIIFSVISLSYLAFYVTNAKECQCLVPASCHADECPSVLYYVYTTDSCPVACDKLGGIVNDMPVQNDSSLNISLI